MTQPKAEPQRDLNGARTAAHASTSDRAATGAVQPHHARLLRTHRVARGFGLVTTAALAFGGTGVLATYADLRNDIERSDVRGHVPAMAVSTNPNDPNAGKALNILVIGTDYRDEANAAIAGKGKNDAGMRADSTMIMHVSGDRRRVEIVSIPRDSIVDIPACDLPGGGKSAPRYNEMFNEAFSIGAGGVDDMTLAAACTITTVYRLTGVPITNHVVVRMVGVVGIVNAIGGVTMCFPEPVKESKHYGTLDLPAGKQTLDGNTSINFLRARHGRGMGLEIGSDLTRIKRQQAFIDSASREILAKNIFTNTPQLYQLVQAVLRSLSADNTLADPKNLAGLAYSLRSINMSEIVFTELPVRDGTGRYKNRVFWLPPADEIWQRMIKDEPPPGHEVSPPADASTATGTSTGTKPPAAKPPASKPATPPAAQPTTAKPAPTPAETRLPGVCP